MSPLVAHVVRETGQLTEPFIARRVHVQVEGFETEEWWESGSPPEGVPSVRIPSRGIRPGTRWARVFHHIPWLGTWQRRAYAQAARTQKPDLIHAHYLTTGWLTSTAGRPMVIGTYGFDVSVMARRPLWRRAFQALARQGPAVLVEGPHMRETLIRLGFCGERVHIVRIAVGHEHLSFNPPREADHPLQLLAAGRFVEKKGFALAIRAFARIRESQPGAVLRIIGAGPLDGELRHIAGASTASKSIEFLGTLNRHVYFEQVRQADLLIAPSLTAANGDSEGGAPTTILDAQAVGTVVVASTHADIPFLVVDGVTGFLGPEGDEDGIVEAVERAIAARERWNSIATAARSHVEEYHSDTALAAGLRDAYLAALT